MQADDDEGRPNIEAELEEENAYEEPEPESFKAGRARLLQQYRPESAEGAAAAALDRHSVLKLLNEYQSLDFEDKIGDVPCRFRYRDVPAVGSGLQADQILGASDKDLNQVLGMKRLAAYRDDKRGMRPNFQKINEIRQQHAPAVHDSLSGNAKGSRTNGDSVHIGPQQLRKKSKKDRHQAAGAEADPVAQRMQSYAKLTLKRSSDGKAKVTKQKAPSLPHPKAAGVQGLGQELSKAQKRNMRRAARRAQESKPA